MDTTSGSYVIHGICLREGGGISSSMGGRLPRSVQSEAKRLTKFESQIFSPTEKSIYIYIYIRTMYQLLSV